MVAFCLAWSSGLASAGWIEVLFMFFSTGIPLIPLAVYLWHHRPPSE
jgi:hypothetical protein